MSGQIKVAVAGANGRMGRLLVRRALAEDDLNLVGVRESERNLAELEKNLRGQTTATVAVSSDPREAFRDAEVVIDFSVPAAVADNINAAAALGAAVLVGVTDIDDDTRAAFPGIADKIPLLVAPNTSLGVAALARLVRAAADLFDHDWDAEILEMHHRRKRDAPSGTAMLLAAAASASDGRHPRRLRASPSRDGERARGDIGFAVLRGGSVAGEHEVIFAGAGERVSLSHRAQDRGLFVSGAISAARWLARQPPGLYSIDDTFNVASDREGGQS
ncbi:MAG: 4-hydroxy-tetrahydrodipicolinate reductase [Alphaproteobacteria bacterium]|nr:4-hydroxy-tetrahydrodipicolinate reductase [Alphaproteobacteria bacterium]MDA8008991.1 4-hydroxy-tetrahydrodipicolinate reductase [Alphaproteobacteria bacterium]MDA8030408.1 4-hydroxy-tetrahydrodipicolinate reductase [Alphaproteobacteria bacterium]